MKKKGIKNKAGKEKSKPAFKLKQYEIKINKENNLNLLNKDIDITELEISNREINYGYLNEYREIT